MNTMNEVILDCPERALSHGRPILRRLDGTVIPWGQWSLSHGVITLQDGTRWEADEPLQEGALNWFVKAD
jgi:hypothetical protein